ncbi:hypothetical protein FRC07_003261 [Ceratobasidium sp. 392]|nr:hypothetical protein FRC07_003261 [Ceratobasidium sp. 392]
MSRQLRRETISWFRHDFERIADATEPGAVKDQLAGVKRSLKAMSPTFSLPSASV